MTASSDYIYHEPESWEHMAKTYTWVVEQSFADIAKRNEETVDWVLKQRERDALKGRTNYAAADPKLHRIVEELVCEFESKADRWMKQQEESRRNALKWQRDRENVREELRRLRAMRLESERRRVAYERRNTQETIRERERKDRDGAKDKSHNIEIERKAYDAYETRWTTLTAMCTPLTFNDIPWPLTVAPHTIDDITPAKVALFLLSPGHHTEKSRKDRIRQALRRWHPDRFGRILRRVAEEDKTAVDEGVGIIARCLNNLLERET